jgi:Methane oxygenase PmoA
MTRRLLLLLLLTALEANCTPWGDAVELRRGDKQIEVLIDGRPFTTYFFDPAVAKPFLSPLRSAEGTILTRRFPMQTDIPGEDRDEPHQRAMYFAHGDINGLDFWGEAAFPKWSPHAASKFGRTVFREVNAMSSGPQSGMLRVTFDLQAPDGTPIAEETQSYVFRGDEHTRIVDCEFIIRANHGPVKVGDTKEGTLAIRVVKSLDSPPAHMVNSRGASGEKEIWGRQAEWVDYYGNVGGEEVGIAIFDHPENLRHPTYWHARGYGLFAANPFGVRNFTHDRHKDGSFTVPSGASVTLRYRVLIHYGDHRQAGVSEAYRQYASQSQEETPCRTKQAQTAGNF